jgi:ribosomal protein S18 acetylase RimI-like enzyme
MSHPEQPTPDSFSEVLLSREIDPAEIQTLRQSVGWDPDSTEVWQTTLETALAVASVRQGDELVGVGFLVGSPRHGVLCDLAVNPRVQENGVGGSIFDELVKQAHQKEIQYVTLTYDDTNTWLKGFYGRHGFDVIENAMQLRNDG